VNKNINILTLNLPSK